MAEFRKADLHDVDTLTQMRVSMLCEGEDLAGELVETLRVNTRRYLQDGLADGSFAAWVACDRGEIVAMGGMSFYTLPPSDWCPGGRTAHLGNMYTLPAYRCQGIATRLLSIAVEEAKGRGCERILLYSTDMGRPIYEKFGFQSTDIVMVHFPFGIKH